MLTTECPWCDDLLVIDAALAEATCATCRVDVDIAADPRHEPLTLAA